MVYGGFCCISLALVFCLHTIVELITWGGGGGGFGGGRGAVDNACILEAPENVGFSFSSPVF
jgi:hypothetical protein